jgi:hypothetical protein
MKGLTKIHVFMENNPVMIALTLGLVRTKVPATHSLLCVVDILLYIVVLQHNVVYSHRSILVYHISHLSSLTFHTSTHISRITLYCKLKSSF